MTDAERFKAGRLKLGLSQREYGVELGYPDSPNLRNQIDKMERGIRAVPAHRMKIMDLLLEKVK